MGKIIIIGLGPGSPDAMTREAERHLTAGHPVYFRTLKHPSARYMAARGLDCHSFDYLYKKSQNFDHVYSIITRRLIMEAKRKGTICYAVPGHPMVGESTVEKLQSQAYRSGIKIKIVEGLSFVEPVIKCLRLDLLDGITILDALALDSFKEPCVNHLIIAQVYSRSLASRVKLSLLEIYPPDYPVTVVESAGLPGQRVVKVKLYNLDRRDSFNHLSTIYLPPFKGKVTGDLIEVMARLRSENGCPWDKKQDHLSLRQYLVEEAYEVVAAIDRGNDDQLLDELGDVLLQVVFHSQIAKEENRFDYYQVVDSIVTKLIRRHPHVFGEKSVENAEQVKVLWEEIKTAEKNNSRAADKLEVDQGLPALLKAYKLQKKAAEMGFDWPTLDGPLEKASEELAELQEACSKGDYADIEEELGDFLFTIVNLSRFLNVNPELALGKTVVKFLTRFSFILEKVEESGREITSFSLEELDRYWEDAKKIRKKSK